MPRDLEDKVKKNKSFVFSCLMVIVLASAVSAQDWHGAYVGGYAGASISRSDASLTTIFSPTGYFATTSPPAINALSPQHPDATNFTGGFTAGYNFQHNWLVLGVEGDFGAINRDEVRSASGTYPCCAPTGFTVSQRVKAGWLATVRPRLGFAAGKALFYGTGGLAVTNLRYQGVFTDTFATAAENRELAPNKAGWIAGGGLEYKVAQHWSVKGEYLYAHFGDETGTSTNLTAFSPPISFPTNVFTHTVDLRSHFVRFGVNWHF